ncbi:MAG: transglycosylase domain-containing protein [Pseudomonadota bacterium]
MIIGEFHVAQRAMFRKEQCSVSVAALSLPVVPSIFFEEYHFNELYFVDLVSLLFVPPESINRHLKARILAIQLSNRFTEDELIEIYLDNSYYGRGVVGLRMAGRVYFAHDLQEITHEELAILFALANLTNKDTSNPEIMSKVKHEANRVLQELSKETGSNFNLENTLSELSFHCVSEENAVRTRQMSHVGAVQADAGAVVAGDR